MSPIEHVWDGLDWRIQQRVPVPANIQQRRTAIEEEWTNIPQTTINNLLNSMWRRCVALREANGGICPPPNRVILHIVESFTVASLRHICAIIMLSSQHLDMLWGGWIISAKEKYIYIYIYIRGGTVHRCHGSVRTSVWGSRFDTISVKKQKKYYVSFHFFWTDSSAKYFSTKPQI